MPFRKKILYYGLLLSLTLLALEGMARIAYYAAYGQGYGLGRPTAPMNSDASPDYALAPVSSGRVSHPFYGYTRDLPYHSLNDMPPRQRRADTVVIGLLGGSVARDVQPFFQDALNRHFAAAGLRRRPVVSGLAMWCGKQPQQALIVAHQLLLGGEFDLLVNLDGVNEMVCSAQNSYQKTFPFFPRWWRVLSGLNREDGLRAGRIAVLRQEQARLTAVGETPILRWSAVLGLVNRYRRERVAAEIIQRNHELAAAESAYTLEQGGPWKGRKEGTELLPAAARVWYRSSVALAGLAELAGAEYYHFLQPSQYVPGAKPLSDWELAHSYAPKHRKFVLPAQGYPLLTDFSRELLRAGLNYFDLSRIFIDHPETLYIDRCCHLNDRGNELLAAAMVQRLEPALRRFGGARPEPPVSPLAAARRPAADTLLLDSNFQVYLRDNKRLRYVRADCAAADTAARFFLHLTPRDLADLPAYRREQGFDNLDFSFAQAGGRLWRGQCLAQIRLPPYPIAYLRTGQYIPDAEGELWAGEFAFPE